MKKIILLLCTVVFLSSFKTETITTIPSGETLTFVGSYNLKGLMTQLAQVTLSTETTNTPKSTYLHLSCELVTLAKWDKFFKIRDVYESYVDPSTLKPAMYKRSVDEGGWTKKEKYVFKGNTVTSTTKRKNQPESTRTFSVGGSTQDVVSMMYKLRAMDLSKLKAGQAVSFTVVFDEKQIPVSAKLLGTETVSAGNLGSKSCYKFSIGAKTNVLKGKDSNLIYLTADDKKVPVLMKFSIPVGTGQLSLSSASGI